MGAELWEVMRSHNLRPGKVNPPPLPVNPPVHPVNLPPPHPVNLPPRPLLAQLRELSVCFDSVHSPASKPP
eukprot:5201081-Pyramimonas_sp.AAC.1